MTEDELKKVSTYDKAILDKIANAGAKDGRMIGQITAFLSLGIAAFVMIPVSYISGRMKNDDQ